MNEIQAKILDIYKAVAAVCERHHLRYYADGGTLIGAVRHGGFIPWDDDADLVMPRPDYDAFIRIAKEELPEGYQLSTYHGKRKDEAPVFFCQVYDLNTQIKTSVANSAVQKPLWIDIFPIDGLPASFPRRKVHQYRLLWNRFLVQISNFDANVHQGRAHRPLVERVLISIIDKTRFGSRIDTATALAKTERLAKKYRYDDEDMCLDVFGVHKSKEVFPRYWFGDAIYLTFEDAQIPCPAFYDSMLKQIFGDYMQLPPAKDRHSDHAMEIITLDKRAKNDNR